MAAELVGWTIHPVGVDPIEDPSHFSLVQGGMPCIPFFTEYKAAEKTCARLNQMFPGKPTMVVSDPVYFLVAVFQRPKTRVIEMPCYGYRIELNEDGRGGTLHRHIDCPEGEAEQRLSAAENLLLAHARSGVDVRDPAYVRGFESVVEQALQWEDRYGKKP